MQPLKPIRITDRIEDALLQRLRGGLLLPGDRLPAERELAAQLGVSRTSLRDAVQRLALLGLLEVRQGGGTFVRQPDGERLSRPFREVLRAAPSSAPDLLEFRMLLEPGVAALAAERVTPAGAALLRASLERQRRADGDLPAEDLLFHGAVAQIAGNTVVLQVLSALRTTLRDIRQAALPAMQEDVTVQMHEEIAQAICAGDAPAAQAAMARHLEDVTRTYRRAAQPQGEPESSEPLSPAR